MSRLGKREIAVPSGVEVKICDNLISVKGPKGSLSRKLSDKINVEIKGQSISVTPKKDCAETMSLWGLTRTLIDNMVCGVSAGFQKELFYKGVGYKASVNGSILTLSLGYSHQIDFPLGDDISAKIGQGSIVIEGIDKEKVGQISAKIRVLRLPEPYKGKGIRYKDEVIARKAGKTGAKK